MDQRETFKNYQQVLSIFLNLQQQQQKAALLIDDGGLTRMEGAVTGIERSDNAGKSTITIDNKDSISLEQVNIAVRASNFV